MNLLYKAISSLLYTFIENITTLGCFFMFIYGLVLSNLILILVGSIGYFLYPIIYEGFLNIWVCITFTESKYQADFRNTFENLRKVPIPVIYHPRYNVTACGIEKLHPFDAQKYGKVFQRLCESSIITKEQIHEPGSISRATLLQVHTKKYLLTLCYSLLLTSIVEVPVCILPASFLRWRVLDPMLYATKGTIDGGLLALDRGWAINLSGGYHHACGYRGGGFCVYADITLVIKHLQKYYSDKVRKAMIIDLDAHQGNGHERDFISDLSVCIVDVYNSQIYPGDQFAKQAITVNVPLSSLEKDNQYLQKLLIHIPKAIQEFKPDFILYNAGTDCLINDPLGNLSITEVGIIQRDEIVFDNALAHKIPILMVLSGGYQQSNAEIIAKSITNLFNKFNLDQRSREYETQV